MKHLLFWLVVIMSMVSCSSNSAGEKTGSEGGPCYPNDTCDNGLVCLSDLCVNLNVDSDTLQSDEDTNYPFDNDQQEADTAYPDDNDQQEADTAYPADNEQQETDTVNPDDNDQQDVDVAYPDDDSLLDDVDAIGPTDTSQPDDDVYSLEWLNRSSSMMNWTDAGIYCAAIGGRLPTISELRTLIQNCSGTVATGTCNVTDTCLASLSCYSSSCEGCTTASDGRYSVLGDTGWLWSSSPDASGTDQAWPVNFSTAAIHSYNKASLFGIRCVK